MPAYAFSPRRLREARAAAGLRRERVAAEIGRSAFSYTAYELGRTAPAADLVAAMANVLGIPPGELFEQVEQTPAVDEGAA
jgi:transcriptional regulator with XRE-family HTH domain